MVEDLISKVTAVEDIPTDLASDLVALLEMIVTRTPSIFPVSFKIYRKDLKINETLSSRYKQKCF